MPLLEVRNLTKIYPGAAAAGSRSAARATPAVDEVSLSIAESETLGLVGESGCGKTTLSRCILQLEPVSSGEVFFDGENLGAASSTRLRALRRRMQIVFQDPFGSLDPRWSVGRTIAEPLQVHKMSPGREARSAEVVRLLAEVGLPAGAAQRFPHEFSGGQRQRIGIARALALQPRLLIADEPVSALDVSVRAQVLSLLRTAQQRHGLAMLFIAHDLAAVRQVSHRIAVMYRGKIVEIGPAAQIFSDPRHPYTRSLLGAIPSIRRRSPPAAEISLASRTEQDEAEQVESPGGCRYRARCPFARNACAEQDPPPAQVGPDHIARCLFAADLPAYSR